MVTDTAYQNGFISLELFGGLGSYDFLGGGTSRLKGLSAVKVTKSVHVVVVMWCVESGVRYAELYRMGRYNYPLQ